MNWISEPALGAHQAWIQALVLPLINCEGLEKNSYEPFFPFYKMGLKTLVEL